MANTQKKITTKTATTKTAAKTTDGRSQSSKQGSDKSRAKPRPAPSPWRRTAGGMVCLLLALLLGLSIFGVEAIFIDFLAVLVKGLLGYGFWFMPLMLLVAAYLLFFRRQEPIALRITCLLLLPMVLAGILHVLLRPGRPFQIEVLKLLWAEGRFLVGGGVLAGGIAEILSLLVSKIGAFFIFLLGLALLILAAFRMTPEKIVMALRNTYRNRPRRWDEEDDYYDDEYYDDYDDYNEAAVPAHAALDLPLDERTGEVLQPKQEGSKRRSLFKREGKAKPPHEVIQDMQKGSESSPPHDQGDNPAYVAPDPEPIPAHLMEQEETAEELPTPVPAAVVAESAAETATAAIQDAPVPEPLLPERELSKSEKKEVIREHLESVAKDAATSLETVPEEYSYPPLELLHEMGGASQDAVQDELEQIQQRLSDTIRSFGIEARIAGAVRGPSVTRYEVELEQGVRLNRLTNLADDIALALGAVSVRIAPVPGRISLVGIEVPNLVITPVAIREVISSPAFSEHKSRVAFTVGKDIGGNYVVGDAARLPHLLIAGTTGSGKSVCTNSLIISMLYKATPEEVRLIMIDPKMVELGIYNGIPHLLIPVVTDPKKAAGALQWTVAEMMKRYRLFSEVGVRDLSSYNAQAEHSEELSRLPQIVVVIDELADLMLVAAKEVEESICRVAQMGRASGIHLIIATQRPSADVITGLMKANIPSRIAFAVSSAMESRIILDTQGAEKLVGKGDMLWYPQGAGKPLRVQGCLIGDDEVSAVAEYVKASGTASYDESVLQEIDQHVADQGRGKSSASTAASTADEGMDDGDELLPAAVEIVLELGQASVSMLQRRLKLGYARAARLVDQMEDRGVVGPFEGSKPRQLLMTKEQWDVLQGKALPESEEMEEPQVQEVYDQELPEPEEELPPWEEEL